MPHAVDRASLAVLDSVAYSSPYRSNFCVAGISVELSGSRPQDVVLVPTLEPFRTEHQNSDLTIDIQWAESFSPPPDTELFDSGSVWRLYANDQEFQFDLCAPILGEQPYKRLIIDNRFERASLTMNARYFSENLCAPAPLDYPLDELLLMHRLTREAAIELHGCGIVRADGTGNLFVGHSGAGKSTTTRLWNEREKVEVLSDDRIIIRRNTAEERLGPYPGGILMYGTPWHGEARYASPASAPISRIFILEHGKGNLLTRLSSSQAVAELFARSFVPFHRHEYVDHALDFLHEVVDAVPVYRYCFEPDTRAVDRILEFHD